MTKFSSNREIADLLSDSLVPIEPRADFVRHLRARLVRYQGSGPSPAVAVAVSLAIVALIFLTSFGIALRVLLALIAALGDGASKRQSAAA